jgi:hypothetical protein
MGEAVAVAKAGLALGLMVGVAMEAINRGFGGSWGSWREEVGSNCFRRASAAWTLFLSSCTSSRDMRICRVRGVGLSVERRGPGSFGRARGFGGVLAALDAGVDAAPAAVAAATMLKDYILWRGSLIRR